MEKISLDRLAQMLDAEREKKEADAVQQIQWNGMTLDVKYAIGIEEMDGFVQAVVDSVFVRDKNGTLRYAPALEEPVFALTLLAYYTNLGMLTDAKALDLKLLGTMLYQSELFSLIRERINPEQMGALEDAAEAGIAFRKKEFLWQERRKLDLLIDRIDALAPFMEEGMKRMANITPEEMSAAMQALMRRLEEERAEPADEHPE